MKIAILTISDSSFAGARPDESGPTLAAICRSQNWEVSHSEVLPDDQTRIAGALRTLADSHQYDVILTTGGTGVAPRDLTPDATRAIIEKELPGISELMRAEGLKYTRRAALSRAVAGTRGETLIVNLPGSPKGARQSLDAILDLVPHVVELLHGHTAHPTRVDAS